VALSPEVWRLFLATLGEEPEAAGQRYELLRRRLILFFAARHCQSNEDLADITLDRTASRIAAGLILDVSLESFTLGIARNVAREQWKKPAHSTLDWDRFHASKLPTPHPASECLELCLRQLPTGSRITVERFYSEQGATKIQARQSLAAQLGIDANALRVRMHRIRQKLEKCILECEGCNESQERNHIQK
jgi:DNA-directed RNA polymerase specialized sigma24 family protein